MHRLTWTDSEILDLVILVIRSYEKRLQKARAIYQKQEETIANLRENMLFSPGNYVKAPPDFAREYHEKYLMLKKAKKRLDGRQESS